MTRNPQYETIRELDLDGDCGDVSGFHLLGHGHTPDVIEAFLNTEATDYFDDGEPTEFEVSETWVRKVPIPSTGNCRYVYSGPGRGARAVTLVEPRTGRWAYWCINHPEEPAVVGVPAELVIDGEQTVQDRLAVLATEVDPRVDVRDDRRGGYLYMCLPCHRAFCQRQEQAQAQERQNQAGAA